MATRPPQRNTNSQASVRSGSGDSSVGDDGVVFKSMNEFWRWVAIVTLIIFCIMILSFMVAYQSKQLSKAEAIIFRLEEKDRKHKLLKEKEE